MGKPTGRMGAEHMSQLQSAFYLLISVQGHVDFADCKTSLSHHGRQISESESEAQGTATGESQKRGSKETATGLGPQGGAEKEVDDAARQQPWFVRRFRPAQLGEGDLQILGSGERTACPPGAGDSSRACGSEGVLAFANFAAFISSNQTRSRRTGRERLEGLRFF